MVRKPAFALTIIGTGATKAPKASRSWNPDRRNGRYRSSTESDEIRTIALLDACGHQMNVCMGHRRTNSAAHSRMRCTDCSREASPPGTNTDVSSASKRGKGQQMIHGWWDSDHPSRIKGGLWNPTFAATGMRRSCQVTRNGCLRANRDGEGRIRPMIANRPTPSVPILLVVGGSKSMYMLQRSLLRPWVSVVARRNYVRRLDMTSLQVTPCVGKSVDISPKSRSCKLDTGSIRDYVGAITITLIPPPLAIVRKGPAIEGCTASDRWTGRCSEWLDIPSTVRYIPLWSHRLRLQRSPQWFMDITQCMFRSNVRTTASTNS